MASVKAASKVAVLASFLSPRTVPNMSAHGLDHHLLKQ